MAHHRQARRAEKHHPDLPAVPRPGAEPSREHLAVPAGTVSQTSSSKPTTTSSPPPATPGASSSPSQKPSPLSECANGPTSVRPHDSWYHPWRATGRWDAKCLATIPIRGNVVAREALLLRM